MSVPRRDKETRRVPLIVMSDALKEASAATGITPGEFGTTSFTGTTEQTEAVKTRGVERLKRSLTERAGGSQAAASKPPKVERSVEDRTSDSVVFPKLERPYGSTPKAREGYRDAQLAKANKLGIPRSRVSILPPDADDYPETVAGPIPSRRATPDLGEKIKRRELPIDDSPAPGPTTRHTKSKVSTDFDNTKNTLLSALQEARTKHKKEGTSETQDAYNAARKAYNAHARRGQRLRSI